MLFRSVLLGLLYYKSGYGWGLGEEASLSLLNGVSYGIAFGGAPARISGGLGILEPDETYGPYTQASSVLSLDFWRNIDLDLSYEERALMPVSGMNWQTICSEIFFLGAYYGAGALAPWVCSANLPILPLVNFSIRGLLTYGMYKARLSSANFPFSSIAALGADFLRFGFVVKWE